MSGSIALILEASTNNIFGNDLGWRDVQEILATSACHLGSDIGDGFKPGGIYDEHHPWQINGAAIINGGGYHFSPDYGFGYIDVHAAVRLAETWGMTRTSHNLVTESETLDLGEGMSFSYGNSITFEVTGPAGVLDLDVLELIPVFSHEAYREVQITVTSPWGTTSNLFDTPGFDNSDEDIANWIAQYGAESFGGTFTDRTILSRFLGRGNDRHLDHHHLRHGR